MFNFQFWQNMWSPIRSFLFGGQHSGAQPGSGYYIDSPGRINEDSALGISAFWRGVNLYAKTIAALPLEVSTKRNGVKTILNDHWLAKLFTARANLFQNRYEFFEYQIANLIIHGNMYARKINGVDGNIVALFPMTPLQIKTYVENFALYHKYEFDGVEKKYIQSDIWHTKIRTNWITGRSALSYGCETLGLAIGAERSAGKIFKSGAKPYGSFSTDQKLTPDQREMLRTSYASLMSESDVRPLVLESGVSFQKISLSPSDIGLLDSRRFSVDDIGRLLDVPSVLLNQNTAGATSSGINDIIQFWYKTGLGSVIVALEESMRSELLTDKDRADGIDVCFKTKELFRLDLKLRMEANRIGINSAIITPNEAREDEGRAPIEGGEKLYIQGAMVPIELAGKQNNVGAMPLEQTEKESQ